MELLGIVASVLGALAATWALLVALLLIVRPRDLSVGDIRRFVPDVVRLIRDLSHDTAVSGKIRRRLGLLLVYLAFPIDLVPDFIPFLGYADDIILIALVLRSIVRQAGIGTLERHWQGTHEGLRALHSLVGIAQPGSTP